jgi:hypothetical protein
MPLPGQLLGQMPQRLGRPAQRRLRIPALIRLDQRQQRRGQLRVVVLGSLAPAARRAHPTRRQRIGARVQFGHTPTHGGLAAPGDPGDRTNAAVPKQPRLGRQGKPPLPLVPMRQQHPEPEGELRANLLGNGHTAPTRPDTRNRQVDTLRLHKVRNVLGALPASVHAAAKRALNEILAAEDRVHAERAIDAFAGEFGVKWPRAVAKVTDHAEGLLTVYDYPAEHWLHLRTTNPIESTFSPVRARTRVTKGPGTAAAGLAMVFKLLEAAEQRWRKVNGPKLVALVRAGARFERGQLVERPVEEVTSEATDGQVAA